MQLPTAAALFRTEYQHELEDWLRRRFRSFCIVCMAIVLLGVIWELLASSSWTGLLFTIPAAAVSIGVISTFAITRTLEHASREQIVAAATTLILVLGFVAIGSEVGRRLILDIEHRPILYRLFLWHLLACLFLPWTARESIRPFIPLVIAWAAAVLLLPGPESFVQRVLVVALGLLVFAPGIGLCIWRLSTHSREFRQRMVGKHFMTMRQEISRARSIHETMFPAKYNDGHIAFDYVFRPMRDMGGDYIHLHVGPEGTMHVTLLDVTGHGLAAALTVNRLYGELERIRAEQPHIEPVDMLRLLNRYVHLTLARHNIFATAVCLSANPYDQTLHWAAAGHPPGFVRRASGNVTELEPTAMILGAVGDDEFDPQQTHVRCASDDTIIIYTDGAFEARNRAGSAFGLDSMRELVRKQPAPRNWPQFITSMIEKHNAGRHEDDVLVATVTFLQPRRETGAAPLHGEQLQSM